MVHWAPYSAKWTKLFVEDIFLWMRNSHALAYIAYPELYVRFVPCCVVVVRNLPDFPIKFNLDPLVKIHMNWFVSHRVWWPVQLYGHRNGLCFQFYTKLKYLCLVCPKSSLHCVLGSAGVEWPIKANAICQCHNIAVITHVTNVLGIIKRLFRFMAWCS